ncbi:MULTISPECIES: molybdopterin-dependent oxidoreductase [unclassified Streptomyces]|uniref:molybdopterin-dependent oxidoreductase n=1 Tax=unclassified Streptomyces TaxID=2593676 RepID=UPI002D21B881|nr:molybdopterin-dependent oxidoreductase [Streptomyces sp. NRRL F-2747]
MAAPVSNPAPTAEVECVMSVSHDAPARGCHMSPVCGWKDPLTLLALRLDGEVLSLDHGCPARIIAPNRPGVL